MKPKQIVIDKEAFIRIKLDALCDFARNHLLLLSDTLLYECATTAESQRARRLRECMRLFEAGGYYCGCSVTFIQWEGSHLTHYPCFLADLHATGVIRTGKLRLEDASDPDAAKDMFLARSTVAQQTFMALSTEHRKALDSEHKGVADVIKKEMPADRRERLCKWLERIAPREMYQRDVDWVPQAWITEKKRFCLSEKWISWQYIRLVSAVTQDYSYLQQKGGAPGNTRAEHDYQDMEYVLLLSRADGIISSDKGVIALAKAAFPEKDVFSSLEEVPESYRCDWTGG